MAAKIRLTSNELDQSLWIECVETELPTLRGRRCSLSDPDPVGRETSRLRHNLRVSTSDGLACSVTVGIGENYLPAFALALGMGELVAGWIACVPLLAGAVLQLISPRAVERIGSVRRWVVLCVACQALSFIPLIITALTGHISPALLFVLAAVYWGSGMASGPAWSNWIDTLVPHRVRARYFGRRSRLAQLGLFVGFVGGGFVLQWGLQSQRLLFAFAILFLAAAICRFASAAFLASQSDAQPTASGTAPVIALRGLTRRLRTRGDGRLLLYLWGTQFAAQIAMPFFGPYMLSHLAFSYSRYVVVISFAMAIKAIALPTLGRLAERFGAARLLWFSGLAIMPLPALWTLGHTLPYLLFIQLCSGIGWAGFELASLLMFFEAIAPRERIGMLTLYNLGNAGAMVAGSLCGGFLLVMWGANAGGYLAVFALSSIARILMAPLLRRVRLPEREQAPQSVAAVFAERAPIASEPEAAAATPAKRAA
jgi:MFS family permease